MKQLKFSLYFIILLVMFVACAAPEEVDLAALVTVDDIPTVEAPATATPAPLPTRIPTNTPFPTPTVAVTLEATVAPLPSPTPTIAVTDTPTPRPFTIVYATAFSTQGEPINVHQFGWGETHLMLIGGIHGGYEWNTVLLMYEMIDWYTANPDAVPENMRLSIIPVANPDGLKLITGSAGRFSTDDVPYNTDSGRFNANEVDLNRNWDCDWEPVGFWRRQEVSAGAFAESEIETQALRFFIEQQDPEAVIFYHSAASAIYPGQCQGIRADWTDQLLFAYEVGSGYLPPAKGGTTFSYPITGSAPDYLALKNIAAMDVELTDHINTEFDRNLSGVSEVIRALVGDS